MTSRNDITGDSLSSKKNSNKYRTGWDRIFGDKEKEEQEEVMNGTDGEMRHEEPEENI